LIVKSNARKGQPKLTIELVPSTSWFTNLRSLLTQRQWDIVRRRCYRDAHYICEICHGRGPKWPVECHEVWSYDDATQTQILMRTIALCPKCHEVKHIGLAQARGHLTVALKHLMKVNRWTLTQAEAHRQEAFAEWEGRCEYDWQLDVSWLLKNFKFQRLQAPGSADPQ
jgi:hypothetical protein